MNYWIFQTLWSKINANKSLYHGEDLLWEIVGDNLGRSQFTLGTLVKVSLQNQMPQILRMFNSSQLKMCLDWISQFCKMFSKNLTAQTTNLTVIVNQTGTRFSCSTAMRKIGTIRLKTYIKRSILASDFCPQQSKLKLSFLPKNLWRKPKRL